jgi:Domain of unknown function (DUF1707)/Cell wall-active antibiotics response 4TMS YvqF
MDRSLTIRLGAGKRRQASWSEPGVSLNRVVDPSQRVSDREREEMVELLRTNLLAGRLTLDEFAERVEVAYGARLGGDLIKVSEDLPDVRTPQAPTKRKRSRLTVSLFGHTVRRGRLRLRRRTAALSVFADVDLDLREAEIEDARIVVTVIAILGNVDVYLPEGVKVDVGGITIFGHQRDWGRETPHETAPRVQVRALGLFGTIDVWRVPRRMGGRYGEVTRQIKERQRELPP